MDHFGVASSEEGGDKITQERLSSGDKGRGGADLSTERLAGRSEMDWFSAGIQNNDWGICAGSFTHY